VATYYYLLFTADWYVPAVGGSVAVSLTGYAPAGGSPPVVVYAGSNGDEGILYGVVGGDLVVGLGKFQVVSGAGTSTIVLKLLGGDGADPNSPYVGALVDKESVHNFVVNAVAPQPTPPPNPPTFEENPIPCATATGASCPGSDFPITNYSSEAPEQQPVFYSLQFPSAWDKMGCLTLCTSTISQEDADLCALAQEALCNPVVPPGGDIFYSQGTNCVCVSEGESSFFYRLPGAIFSGPTQAYADALAQSYACIQCHNPATSFRLGAIATELCAGVSVSITIPTSSTHRPSAFFVTAGELPVGTTLNALTGVISGTPSTAGNYTFTIQASRISGSFAQRAYSLCVVEILPATLADGTVGTAYTTSFSAGCAAAALSWQVVAGALPPGMALDETTGALSGSPTVAGSYSFTIGVSTSAT